MNKNNLTIKKLNLSHLDDVMKLQQTIIDGLHPDEKHFILQRTVADYQKSLEGKSSSMIGIFDGDKLIAQTVYMLPQDNEGRDMPEFKPEIKNSELVIFEGILVDPNYRGTGLMHKMLQYVEEKALNKDRTHAIIQIAIDNPASWMSALHYGMNISKVDLDPSDGVKVIYLEKDIVPAYKKPRRIKNKKIYNMYLGDNIHQKIPALFLKMQHLIAHGYKGVGFNKQTRSLVWAKDDSRLKSIQLLHANNAHIKD